MLWIVFRTSDNRNNIFSGHITESSSLVNESTGPYIFHTSSRLDVNTLLNIVVTLGVEYFIIWINIFWINPYIITIKTLHLPMNGPT